MKLEKNVDFGGEKGHHSGEKLVFYEKTAGYAPPFALTSRGGTVIIDMYMLMGRLPA
jgi:hypothetical protein